MGPYSGVLACGETDGEKQLFGWRRIGETEIYPHEYVHIV